MPEYKFSLGSRIRKYISDELCEFGARHFCTVPAIWPFTRSRVARLLAFLVLQAPANLGLIIGGYSLCEDFWPGYPDAFRFRVSYDDIPESWDTDWWWKLKYRD